MPGRLRTASSPSRTVIAEASYAGAAPSAPGLGWAGVGSTTMLLTIWGPQPGGPGMRGGAAGGDPHGYGCRPGGVRQPSVTALVCPPDGRRSRRHGCWGRSTDVTPRCTTPPTRPGASTRQRANSPTLPQCIPSSGGQPTADRRASCAWACSPRRRPRAGAHARPQREGQPSWASADRRRSRRQRSRDGAALGADVELVAGFGRSAFTRSSASSSKARVRWHDPRRASPAVPLSSDPAHPRHR